jgi:hypothetical protein
MTFPLSAYQSFASRLTIPSRDQGLILFDRPFGTQLALRKAIAAGWERDIHDFVILKGGRQIGGSTEADALSLYWLQHHHGMVGQMVSDDLPNLKYRRKVMRAMLTSLPRAWRFPINQDNLDFLEWAAPCRSTLVFDYAGLRTESNLGRSKGLNYLYADEVGSWPDQKAVSALEAALSEKHPHRLYLWISTARGFNTFKAMWDGAKGATARRRIFLAWWQHDGYRVERDSREYKRYGGANPRADERLWIEVIKRRYRRTISREQLAWYRWTLREKFFGDETMMAQEFSCIPEDAFQAFGDKFIEPVMVQGLRVKLEDAPEPTGLRYEWAGTIDAVRVHECEPREAPLRVWEQPDPEGVYVVAGHPSWSSSPEAAQFVAMVFRVWPDRITQVAEYATDAGAMYQFAWVLLHLAGAYRMRLPAYMIVEVGATGYRVLEEIQMLERYGFGLSVSARGQLGDVLGSVRHYFYFRPDSPFTRTAPQDWKTGPNNRAWLLHGLRDALERGHLTIRSAALLDELAALRRGEEGDNDQIAGGAGQSDSRAICAALGVQAWSSTAIADLDVVLAPREPGPEVATSVQQRMVQHWIGSALGR